MPLNLPDRLPAIELLKEENIFVIDHSRASAQDIRPLKIVILNLMPLKITTETDLVRLLSNSPLQVEVSFMKVKGHTPKNTPIEHMKAFYKDFELMRDERFDGMIITGAPVEHLISVGLHRPDFIIIMAFRNILCLKRCSVSFRNILYIRNCRFSEDSMMSFICRTAGTRKSIGRMYFGYRN